MVYFDPVILNAVGVSWHRFLGDHHLISIYDPKAFLQVYVELPTRFRYLESYLPLLPLVEYLSVADFLFSDFVLLVDVS